MRPAAFALGVLLALALAGCPEPADPTDPWPPAEEGQDGDGEADAGGAGSDGDPDEDADPLEGSVFSEDELFAIYRADVAAPEAERLKVLREHRLVDAEGNEVPARVKAYERALQQYARNDPEGWADFVESLPR